MAGPCIIDGVFGMSHHVLPFAFFTDYSGAINKPRSLSSAQVVRDLQKAFNPSRLFAPSLAAEKVARDNESRFQRRRRRDKRVQVKLGHGGTLDPLATGVLVIGVGKGTRQLSQFLDCTKSYDTTLLLGAATDTYDVLGKVLVRASFDHVTRSAFEEALESFRGQITQVPPIYSAIRMQGKRLYEYAREGLELPVEVQGRSVEVRSIEIAQWLEPGSNDLELPLQAAVHEDSPAGQSPLIVDDVKNGAFATARREDQAANQQASTLHRDTPDSNCVRVPANSGDMKTEETREDMKNAFETAHTLQLRKSDKTNVPHTPLAVRLRMTVTSGFYVRSLCHDIGKTLGSAAVMAALSRTRQGDFALGHNVLDYAVIDKGENVWGPKVKDALEEWNMKHRPK